MDDRRNLGRLVNAQHVSVSKKSLSIFGYPYFKDVQLYHPPSNEDSLRKRENGEPDVWLDRQRIWRREDRSELRAAVRKDALRSRLRAVREEKEETDRELHQLGLKDDERDQLLQRMKEIEAVEQDITATPDHKLFEDRHQDFDWMRIAFRDLNTAHTPKVREWKGKSVCCLFGGGDLWDN